MWNILGNIIWIISHFTAWVRAEGAQYFLAETRKGKAPFFFDHYSKIEF
jgi:hypothetical protein